MNLRISLYSCVRRCGIVKKEENEKEQYPQTKSFFILYSECDGSMRVENANLELCYTEQSSCLKHKTKHIPLK